MYPFCRAACHYCNFHFSTTLKNVEDYVTAVVKEVSLRKGEWEGVEFRTLYWGGGTPSVLTGEQCSRIVGALRESLNIRENIKEATIEVNPEDVTLKALKNWVECGFDRISIGIQSFDDHQLSWMNRKHTAAEAESAVMLARGAGFKKVSVDLIYGLPVRSEKKSWQETVKKALSLPIDHISCYALTVEPKTVLGARVKSGKEVEAQTSSLKQIIPTSVARQKRLGLSITKFQTGRVEQKVLLFITARIGRSAILRVRTRSSRL